MIAALVLAACLEPVLFADDGVPCSAAREQIECGCTESQEWDPVPGATSYEIVRTTASTGAQYLVGTVLPVPDDGGGSWLASRWVYARDDPFPREGTLYEYRVLACNENGCTEFADAESTWYRAAPYWCGDNGVEVPCYVADAMASK